MGKEIKELNSVKITLQNVSPLAHNEHSFPLLHQEFNRDASHLLLCIGVNSKKNEFFVRSLTPENEVKPILEQILKALNQAMPVKILNANGN